MCNFREVDCGEYQTALTRNLATVLANVFYVSLDTVAQESTLPTDVAPNLKKYRGELPRYVFLRVVSVEF